jgi:acetyl esterase/lipase
MSILTQLPAFGPTRDRELLKDATTFCYKKTEQGDLHAHVFFPLDPPQGPPTTLLIFFHGGFWDAYAATQFATQCLYFAERGCVCIAAETRVSSRHQSSPLDAIEDAQDLIIATKKNASTLGIDPQKVVLAGAAGGALLALHAAMRKHPRNDEGVDSRPQALVLFSALVDTSSGTDHVSRFGSRSAAKANSPLKMTRRKLPPMLFLHAKNDRMTPLEPVHSFRRWMRWKGNKVDVIEYEAVDHRFFNFNCSPTHHDLTMQAMEGFLQRHQLLPKKEDDGSNERR